MLKSQVTRELKNFSEQSKQMRELVDTTYTSQIDMLTEELKPIRKEYNHSIPEDITEEEKLKIKNIDKKKSISRKEYDEISTEKKRLEKELKAIRKEYKESLEEIDSMDNEIMKDIDTKHSSNVDPLNFRNTLKEIDKQTIGTEEKKEQLKNMLLDIPTLTILKSHSSFLTKAMIKKEVVRLVKEAQSKVAKNQRFIFDPITKLKPAIKSILSEFKELDDKEINANAKIILGHISKFILDVDFDQYSLYIYYLLTSIYNLEHLEIEDSLQFKKSLYSIIDLY